MNQYPAPYTSYPPRTEGLATASLILGILSLVACNVVTGIPAIICGHTSRSRIESSNGALGGAGMALTGLILGYVSIALMAVSVAGFVLVGAGIGISLPFLKKAVETSTIESAQPKIIAACNRYRADNGRFPTVNSGSGEQVSSEELFAILAKVDRNGNAYYTANQNQNQTGSAIHVNGVPHDIWGQPLQVALDLDGDGKVNLNGTLIDGSVLVWSKGLNQQNEFGGGDDVRTW